MKPALAVPLIRFEVFKGVLYLEKRLTEAAFTPRHLRVLELLCSQIAISIENAEFYDELEGLVEKRTAQLSEVNEDLEQANRRLEKLSQIDGLTGIANRRLFDECLQTEWKCHRRLARGLSLAMCDIDCFKRYND